MGTKNSKLKKYVSIYSEKWVISTDIKKYIVIYTKLNTHYFYVNATTLNTARREDLLVLVAMQASACR